jgi:hypothetical protein
LSSPPIAAGTKAVSVEVGGLSEEDLVTLKALRGQCFVDFTRKLARSLVLVRAVVAEEIAHNWSAKNPEEAAGIEQQIVADGLSGLVECTRLVDAVTAVLAKGARASAAATSCAFVPVKLSVTGSRLRSFRVGRAGDRGQPLQVSCTHVGGGLRISVKAGAGASLRSVVGSRLRIGIRRSRRDAAGSQVSATFRRL